MSYKCPTRQGVERFELIVPIGYSVSYRKFDGESCPEKLFIYPDSSVIFISKRRINNNYKFISEDKTQSDKYFSAYLKMDSLTIEGKDTEEKYWKTYMSKNIVIGYSGVRFKSKKSFDLVINSLKVRSAKTGLYGH